MPGVNPANLNSELQILEAAPGLLGVAVGPLAEAYGVPALHSEPPLECYVFAACEGKDAPTLKVSSARSRSGDETVLRPVVRVREGYQFVSVPGVELTVAGHRARTNGDGRAALRMPLASGRDYRLTASLPGCNPAVTTIRGG